MIPSNIVKQKTGLSKKQLSYLCTLRLIPHPTRMPTGHHAGSSYAYPATIFTRIHVIQFLQGHGFTLTKIVRAARGTPFECPNPDPCTD